MKKSKDKFSAQAKEYYKFRPHYPELLHGFLYSKVQNFDRAWDCGTGNGQVAVKLAGRFKEVFATDISEKQLKEAPAKENITYTQSRAEKADFPDNYFDLITVAQAVHWFDLDSFYAEVKRVAKPNAVVALWGYNLIRISAEIDRVVDAFYNKTLGSYWDAERKPVQDEYRSLPFPFREIEVPKFEIVADWSFGELMGFFNSWSAVQNFIEANGTNPVDDLENQVRPFWSEGELKKVRFRVFSRIGTVEK